MSSGQIQGAGAEPCGTSVDAPRVSCVVATRARADFLAQSIRYFQAQDYPHRELLIVYEDDCDLPVGATDDARVRVLRAPPGASIGHKRNLGVRASTGEIIAQWDDDDWYGRSRLSVQIAPLIAGHGDITGLFGALFFDLEDWAFWTCDRHLHRRMFVADVLGGTLVYWRRLWDHPARYPDTSLREDADFLVQVLDGGARLVRVPAADHYLYARHGDNTWRFRTGQFLSPARWQKRPEPAFLASDRAFYRSIRAARLAPAPPSPAASACRPLAASTTPRPSRPTHRPTVACIMPTADRPHFVRRALGHFLRQNYPERELVVVDDGDQPVAALMPDDARVHYIRLASRLSLGQKRNLACEHSDADIIIHWDDDDWMAPTWIDTQVRALVDHDADVVGLRQVYFYRPEDRRAWLYTYPADLRPWVHGATLCYTRRFWQTNPFPAIDCGEDMHFLWARASTRVHAHDHSEQFVSTIHAANTSPKLFRSRRWRNCPAEIVERLLLGQ